MLDHYAASPHLALQFFFALQPRGLFAIGVGWRRRPLSSLCALQGIGQFVTPFRKPFFLCTVTFVCMTLALLHGVGAAHHHPLTTTRTHNHADARISSAP
jgi:hypothetical protein